MVVQAEDVRLGISSALFLAADVIGSIYCLLSLEGEQQEWVLALWEQEGQEIRMYSHDYEAGPTTKQPAFFPEVPSAKNHLCSQKLPVVPLYNITPNVSDYLLAFTFIWIGLSQDYAASTQDGYTQDCCLNKSVWR